MFNEQQARDAHGRWTAGSHDGEAGARHAGRFPVTAHDGAHAPSSHTGTLPTGAMVGKAVRDLIAGARGLGAASASAQRRYEKRARR